MLKLLLPLVVIAGIVVAGVAFYAEFTQSTTSSAGTFPTAVARPGLIGQTPVPPPLRAKPDAAVALLDADEVLQAVMSDAQQTGASVTPGTAHAALSTVGALPNLQNASIASDYPVWVVTLSGSFSAPHGPPESGRTYTTATYYIDAYSGEQLGFGLTGGTLMPAPARAPIPVRDAPVIDAATATQHVEKLAGDAIQSGTLSAVLTTCGAVSAEFAKKYASAYPVWAVTADAVARHNGTEPIRMTFYVDGYSGEILVTDQELAPTASPTPP